MKTLIANLLLIAANLAANAAEITIQWDRPLAQDISTNHAYEILSLKIMNPPRSQWPPAASWDRLLILDQVVNGNVVTNATVLLQDDGRVMVVRTLDKRSLLGGTNFSLASDFSGALWVHEKLQPSTGLTAKQKL
jgi:hypothetical protein